VYILVMNSGSSSLKFSMFASGSETNPPEPSCLFEGQVSNIGEPDSTFEINDAAGGGLGHSRSGVKAVTLEESA
jgi:acetate kinase